MLNALPTIAKLATIHEIITFSTLLFKDKMSNFVNNIKKDMAKDTDIQVAKK